MTSFSSNELADVLAQRSSPCLSLYQPTYRSPPEQRQNGIRFDNLLKQMSDSLENRLGKRAAEELIAPVASLAEDPALFKPVLEGLAVLSCPGFLRVLKLHRSVPEMAIVADTFHIKPLIRILQTADRFQVLGITESHVRLFEGNRDAVDELPAGDNVPRTIMEALPNEYTDPSMPPGVDPESRRGFGGPVVHVAPRSRVDSYSADVGRFFRVVDSAMTEHHSRRKALPLILAALPQHHATFRSVSENPYLLAESINADPLALSADDIREKAWKLLEPHYLARIDDLREEFHGGKSKQLAQDDPNKLAEAAAMSRVRTLLVDESKRQKGRVNFVTGVVTPSDSDDSDLFDDLAELVLRRGGEVLALPPGDMPTSSGIAGIYRF